ncbi:MAG: FHA domain-containing protein [bacterium]
MSKVKVQIQFVSGEYKGEFRELPEGTSMVLGRSRSATFRFSAPDVSGKHLELTLLPSGDVAIKNLSSHRTDVNGQALSEGEAVILSEGDRVAFGDTNAFILISAPKAMALEAGDPDGPTCATNFALAAEVKAMMPSAAPVQKSVAPPVSLGVDEAKTEIPDEDAPVVAPKPYVPVAAARVVAPAPVDDDATVVPEAPPQVKAMPAPAPAPARMPAPKKVAFVPPPQAKVDDEEVKTAQAGEDEGDDETMMMQTRVASMEEMDLLRKTRKPKANKRVIWLAAAMGISAFLVGIRYVVSQTNIENPITWPMDGDKFNDEVLVPDIGVDKDFILYFPRYRSMQVVKESNRIMAMTRLGKRRDVPCRVLFNMNKSLDNLSLNRAKGFKAWQDKMMALGGQWNFDEDSNVHFRGKDNGLPYQMARYTRSVEKVAWFGVVMYIKDRDWEIIVQKEIPSSERYRGEALLVDTPFISVTPRYVLNHWEPGDVTFQMTVPEMLSEARLMLNRTVATPRMWPHILDLLRNIMGASLRTNDMATYTVAMELLRDLRTKQSQWLNNQKIQYFGAIAKNLSKLAATIRQDCLAVFSDEDDFRCHQLRNDQWE